MRKEITHVNWNWRIGKEHGHSKAQGLSCPINRRISGTVQVCAVLRLIVSTSGTWFTCCPLRVHDVVGNDESVLS